GSGGTEGALGGAGVSNAATTVTLTNSGTIGGGKGGFGGSAGGPGGAGVSNGGTIVTLSNGGKILGGNGGDAQRRLAGLDRIAVRQRPDRRRGRSPRRVRDARQFRSDLRQYRARRRRHPHESGASLWRRDARRRRHADRHGLDPRRRDAGECGQLRRRPGR